ncbi:hypothetical protein C2S51_005727 [Perilla frutescens var. frutescens]|nr:hypothetical protein C2S51_005727 [Perilla frutescens var. frutescens]
MKSLLFRTSSAPIPVQLSPAPGSPQLPVSVSVDCGAASPQISLHAETQRRSIRRSASEPNVIRSEMRTLSKLGSRSFTAIPELEYDEDHAAANGRMTWEELGSPGGGMNKNRKSGGGGSGGYGSDAERKKMRAYYQEMIKSNPTDSLLLRNYGKYLHEVEGDVVKAEEYYGRAILASPGDGEVLSLYGKLIWETKRDESRAKSYFTQAIEASPNDCMVLGSYAHFLWEAEEEECRDDDEISESEVQLPRLMVEAF